MHQLVPVDSLPLEGGISAEISFPLVVGVLLAIGCACGCLGTCLLWWACGGKRSPSPPAAAVLRNWERAAARALFFVRRRRRIALAFQNYSQHQLRRDGATRSSYQPAATNPLGTVEELPTPLREGPAIRRRRDGSHGRRTERYEHA